MVSGIQGKFNRGQLYVHTIIKFYHKLYRNVYLLLNTAIIIVDLISRPSYF